MLSVIWQSLRSTERLCWERFSYGIPTYVAWTAATYSGVVNPLFLPTPSAIRPGGHTRAYRDGTLLARYARQPDAQSPLAGSFPPSPHPHRHADGQLPLLQRPVEPFVGFHPGNLAPSPAFNSPLFNSFWVPGVKRNGQKTLGAFLLSFGDLFPKRYWMDPPTSPVPVPPSRVGGNSSGHPSGFRGPGKFLPPGLGPLPLAGIDGHVGLHPGALALSVLAGR